MQGAGLESDVRLGITLAIAVLMSGCQGPAADDGPDETLYQLTWGDLAQGEKSGFRPTGVQAFALENHAQWNAFFDIHAEGDLTGVAAEPDWTKFIAVALFAGNHSTSGYVVFVHNVLWTGNAYAVEYVVGVPSSECEDLGEKSTQPFAIVYAQRVHQGQAGLDLRHQETFFTC